MCRVRKMHSEPKRCFRRHRFGDFTTKCSDLNIGICHMPEVSKSEAVMHTKKRAYRNLEVLIDGVQISIKQPIRYLGVELDTKLNYSQNIEKLTHNAIKVTKALIMYNAQQIRTKSKKLTANFFSCGQPHRGLKRPSLLWKVNNPELTLSVFYLVLWNSKYYF